MTGSGPVGVAIVGCGTISNEYLRNLRTCPDVQVLHCTDLDVERAASQASRYGVPHGGDVASALADPAVELVVNLTIPAAHVVVATEALSAGKHVYGEKPLTLDRAGGAALLADAARRGLRVGGAPDTFLGAGIQSATRAVASGAIGEPQSALICFQSPGPESWHPSPEFLFAVGGGPLLDIGPYYLTTLVALLGPIARVGALTRRGRAERVIGSGARAGTRFPVEVPTHVTALADFHQGPVATMVMSFDSPLQRTGVVEITGTEATLRVPDPNTFTGPVRLFPAGGSEWIDVPVAGTTTTRGIGVVEMARAIRAGRPHRASAELAMHVYDAMASIDESGAVGAFRNLDTRCQPPDPLAPTWDPHTATL